MPVILALLLVAASGPEREIEEENLRALVKIRRVYVDRLNGGETAAQLRDMLISALQNVKLFALTENQEKADAVLRGSAEDLVFTDTFQTSSGINARATIGAGATSTRTTPSTTTRTPGLSLAVGENESQRIAERKHEATASVRLVTKDGDVIWATTQESLGGKFKGASADVADKIARQLKADHERGRLLSAAP
jgi:hypothetical protein